MPGLAADFPGVARTSLPALPALSRLLGRATPRPLAGDYAEQLLLRLLGCAAADETPVAACSYHYDFGRWPETACWRADPVHLRADTSGLILFDSAAFRLADDESRALRETLAAHLAGDGFELECGAADRWYLLAPETPRLEVPALPLVRGRPVAVAALGGADAGAWRNRLNEVQMLLYNHPVNRARAADGRTLINSLWLWGGGTAPAAEAAACTALVSDNPCARGCAEGNRLAVHSIQRAAGLAPLLTPQARLLVTLEPCRDAAAYEDFAAFCAALQVLEDDWFAPLLALLRRRSIDAVELLPVNGFAYRLTWPALWALWRGRRDYRQAQGFFRENACRV